MESGGARGQGSVYRVGPAVLRLQRTAGPGTKSDPVLYLLELIRDELVWTADCALCFVSDRARTDDAMPRARKGIGDLRGKIRTL